MIAAGEKETLTGSEIAIIGMAGRFPGAKDLSQFWQNLCDGVESISFFDKDELASSLLDPTSPTAPNYVPAASILDEVESFAASFFGYTPKEAEIMDPQQRLLLECAWEALEAAGYNPLKYEDAIGVFVGARTNTYLFNLFSNPEALGSLSAFEVGLGNDLAFLSSRIAYKLDLKGPAYSVHTACSTGLVAIHLACQSLLVDECQMALAGSVAIDVPQKKGYVYQEGGIVAPDGHCRAFDAAAAGTIFGSGLGIVVLKRLEDALQDGDAIYAVIRGTAANNDGANKASFTAPSVNGQIEVLLEAMAMAGINPDTISFIEAHGTGTSLGDSIEIRALTKAFRQYTQRNNFCALGSVKTNIGHLDTAAGMASLIKMVLALHHQKLPSTIHFEKANPNLGLESSPFYVNTELADWPTVDHPRRTGISSFGIGGTNVHIILEEAPSVTPSESSRTWHLLPLSAKTDTALEQMTANLAEYLSQNPKLNLADVASTLQVGRHSFSHRRFAICSDTEQATETFTAQSSPYLFTDIQDMGHKPAVFMFAGQGAQYVDMTYGLHTEEPAFREIVDYCAEQLQSHLGCDIRPILYPTHLPQTNDAKPSLDEATEKLNQTSFTQPALFVVQYALAKLCQAWGVQPEAMIGHSIGEYVAACLAGTFSLEDALMLVARRGRLMQQLPSGSMLAVSLPEAELLPRMDTSLSLAAVNSADMCVVSGEQEAVEALAQQLQAYDIVTRPLFTSHAFHSAMMDPILADFAEAVASVKRQSPQIPFVSNVTGSWITDNEAISVDYWTRHLRQTVRFSDGLQMLLQEKKANFIDLGPGRTVSRLVRRHPSLTLEQTIIAAVRHPKDRQPDMVFLLTALGRCWLAGTDINWSQFYTHEQRQRLPLPTYPFERKPYWVAPSTQASKVRSYRVPTTAAKSQNIADWFYSPSWKRTTWPRGFKAEDTAQCWLVFVDELGVGADIVQQLKVQTHDVTVVQIGAQFQQIDDQTYSIKPDDKNSYHQLLQSLDQQGKKVEKLLHLWSLMPIKAPSDCDFFRQVQSRSYYSLLYLMQALAQIDSMDPVHVGVVTNNLHEVYGEPLSPEKAPMLAPCIVTPQEYAHISCQTIDIRLPELADFKAEWLGRFITETQTNSPDPIIAYRGQQRWVRHFEPSPLTEDTRPLRSLRPKGVYLITGGLGGIGLILADYLARTVQARLILTRRSPFPDRDRWDEWLASHDPEDGISLKIKALQTLETVGAEVLVANADVADEAAMQRLLHDIYDQFGQLDGVLHAAGVTSGDSVFQPITAIGSAESELQFQPKVHGLYVLDNLLAGKDVDFCLLFSSNAAVLGGLGFVAYAAANLFMDAFASSRNQQQDSITWLSANWDHWPEETRQYANVRTSMDQYTMSRDESVEAFRRVVCMAPDGQTIVSTGDLATRFNLWLKQGHTPAESESEQNETNAHPRPHVQTTYVPPTNETEQTIIQVWQRVLGIEQVGINDNFFDLGGHSLLATRLVSQLVASFQIKLTLEQFFEAPTVAEQSQIITKIQAQQQNQDDIELLEILEMVDNLPGEAVHAALKENTHTDS